MFRLLLRIGFYVLAVATLFSSVAMAEGSADRVQVGRDIVVQPNEKTGDLVCVGCSIFVRGQTAGEVVAVAGNVVLEQGVQVAGGVTAVAGDVRLQRAVQVAGDVVAVAGTVRRDPTATIAGDVTSLAGSGWMILIFLVPLVLLGGFVALIVWLIQRSRRPAPVAA